MSRYYKSFQFRDTEAEAERFCKIWNASAGRYERKKYPAHYTEWHSLDGKEHKYCCWYWVRYQF